MHILPVHVVVTMVGMLFGLMFYEHYVPSPTEETIALQKEFRQHLFELDEAAAQRFDEAQEHAKAVLAFARRLDSAIHVFRSNKTAGVPTK